MGKEGGKEGGETPAVLLVLRVRVCALPDFSTRRPCRLMLKKKEESETYGGQPKAE